jgi:hypothetical protein
MLKTEQRTSQMRRRWRFRRIVLYVRFGLEAQAIRTSIRILSLSQPRERIKLGIPWESGKAT